MEDCKVKGETPVSKCRAGKVLGRLFNYTKGNLRFFGKCTFVYKGLAFKSKEGSTECRFMLSDTITSRPDSFFLSQQKTDCYVFVSFTGDTINRTRVTKEITFYKDGSWEFHLGSYKVDPNILGLGDTVMFGNKDPELIFNVVNRAKVCKGYLIENHDTCKVIEIWSSSGQGTSEQRVRSSSCDRVLSFTSKTDVCRRCQKTVYLKQNHSLDNDDENIAPNSVPSSLTVLNTENTLSTNQNNLTQFKYFVDNLLPSATDELKTLIMSQHKCLSSNKDPRGRRWDKAIIQQCLTLWNRSPQAYISLRDSGFLILPCPNLLQRYKNIIQQQPGLNREMFHWMHVEAEKNNALRHGGIIFDEMAIQPDLTLELKGGKLKFAGLVDAGPENDAAFSLMQQSLNPEIKIATRVTICFPGI